MQNEPNACCNESTAGEAESVAGEESSATLMSRRGVMLGVAAAGCAVVSLAQVASGQYGPRGPGGGAGSGGGGSAPPAAQPKSKLIAAGALSAIRPGVTDRFIKSHVVAIVRTDDRVYAVSAACTHKGCTVKKDAAGLVCPCHRSTFDLGGAPTHGPATETLPRYGIELKGPNVIINTETIILPGEFDKENAFIPAPPVPAPRKPASRATTNPTSQPASGADGGAGE